MMYPHLVDRYRIIQKLLRMERELYRDTHIRQRGLSQRTLAQSSFVAQSTISYLENLERSVDAPKRRVSRDDLLKVLTLGLKLDREKIDAVLWLFDGSPLMKNEVHSAREHLPNAHLESYQDGELRGVILGWLEELVTHSRQFRRAGPPEIIATGDEKTNLAAVKELIEVEGRPGQRMVAMRYPSFLVLPLWAYTVDGHFQDCARQFRALNELRLRHVACYGERSIHPRASVEGYIESGPNGLTREERRGQLQRWIELLESRQYPWYEVRLSEAPMRFEVNLKTTPPVIVGSMVSEDTPWEESRLIAHWIKLFDEPLALSLLLQFERDWDNVPAEYNTNSKVAEFLRYVLDKFP